MTLFNKTNKNTLTLLIFYSTDFLHLIFQIKNCKFYQIYETELTFPKLTVRDALNYLITPKLHH